MTPPTVKAITLTQPWATLVASGAKRYETRSWLTNYRGPLVIHAATGFPPYARAVCVEPQHFRWRLLGALLCEERDLAERPAEVLPRGALLGITWLEDCQRVEDVRDLLDEEELAFGDYTDGRYAWKLREPLDFAPIPIRGHLGLWNVDASLVPEMYLRAIQHPGTVRHPGT